MNQPHLVCLTNIPTPYRLFFFRKLDQALRNRGWTFEVWFMARSERRRQWSFAAEEFAFPHQFLRGRSLNLAGHTVHFNPMLLAKLRKIQPDVLLVAGSWTGPSVVLAALSRDAKQTIFWSESHLESIAHADAFTNWARRFVLSRFREFAVPGAKARDYVEHFGRPTRIHPLPNVVDPELFNRPSNAIAARYRSALAVPGSKRILLIGARLAPEKGILPFLRALGLLSESQSAGLCVLIAGDGPQREEIARHISSSSGPDIRLLGVQTQLEMAKLYAIADGFCLPSLSDPNPIAVVEALWSGLPLLLSSRVGNHLEMLVEGSNGFLFDPVQPQRAAEAVSRWLDLDAEQLKTFGNMSSRIAEASFDPDCAIERFLDTALPKA